MFFTDLKLITAVFETHQRKTLFCLFTEFRYCLRLRVLGLTFDSEKTTKT